MKTNKINFNRTYTQREPFDTWDKWIIKTQNVGPSFIVSALTKPTLCRLVHY